MGDVSQDIPALVPDRNHYSGVFKLFDGAPRGSIVDVPSGYGAFAAELLKHGYSDIHCLDLYADNFMLKDPGVKFTQHNVINPLPFPDNSFDYAFSIEGLEHFDNPFTFVEELCRIVKPGGRIYITTPNNLSVEARITFLLSGYFPRFRGLMEEVDKVLAANEIDHHISPIYFWQLNYFLARGGVEIRRVTTNGYVYKPRLIRRLIEKLVAGIVRRNIRRRHFPDLGVSSEEMLYGDCLILEAVKRKD